MPRGVSVLCFAIFLVWSSASALLSPKGVNFEGKFCNFPLHISSICRVFNLVSLNAVQALMGIKELLHDPRGVLDNWDGDAVDRKSVV